MPKVTTIGWSAFIRCLWVDSIDIPNVTILGSGIFYGCENLKSINMPKVKTLGYEALMHCAFTSLNLPATLDSIGEYALTNLGLKVKKACLVYINSYYERHGELNIQELFKIIIQK